MRLSLSRCVAVVAEGKADTMDQERRVGLNEAIFRQVNEQIRNLGDELGTDDDGTITVICECGDAGCADRLDLPLAVYERVRGDSLLYVIAKGHQFAEIEATVERGDGYDVVRKQASEAAEVSRETDPRS
jgi:hypothetical protein